jgi:class 3 adenylate cyclase
MGTGVAAEFLPPGSEREIRRLRFADPKVERAFGEEYARRLLPQLRLVMWVILLIQIPLSINALVFDRWAVTDPRFCVRLAIGLGTAIGGFLVIRSPRFARWWQPYMVFCALLMGAVIVALFVPLPAGWARVISFLIAACIVFRLRTRSAVFVALLLIGWYIFFTLRVMNAPATLRQGLPLVGFSAFVLLFGVYLMEHAARRDFLLSRPLAQEREKSEQLLLNILPGPVAERLKEQPGTVADSSTEVTVLVADIVDFTPLSARLSAEEVVSLLNQVFSAFDRLAERHALEKIKTIGDSYMAVGGLLEPRRDHAEAVMAMAVEMQREVARFRRDTGEPLQLRIGIYTGPVVAGVIGTKKFIYDLWGDAVNKASRMGSHGMAGGIQVTQATRDRLRDRYPFTQRRLDDVKGRGAMDAYMLDLDALPVGASARP